MKIIQSFWSGNQRDINNNYGWYSPRYNWISWILSCHQLVRYHKDVELYTDSFGYEILIEKLKLPYTKVHNVLDELNHYHKDLWAIAKIKTFQLQKEPFIHIDGDVFVWESLIEKFEKSNLVTQNLEITTKYYREMWDEILSNLTFVPNEMLDYINNKSNFACNMGIIGGVNLDFFKEYTKKSIEFVDKNKHVWSSINGFNFNIFFEQVLFYEFKKNQEQNVDFLFQEVSLENDYIGFSDFHDVPNKKYLHLLGFYKRNPIACKAMEVYAMKYFPENYSLLTNLFNTDEKYTDKIISIDKNKVSSLINEFDSELRDSDFNTENFLLKRDLFNEGLPNIIHDYIKFNIDFKIIVLQNSFTKETITLNKEKTQVVKIKELNIVPRIYDLDEVDEIILSELDKPIRYFEFLGIMEDYFDEDDQESRDEFIFLINQRLRNYLVLKIISIYN